MMENTLAVPPGAAGRLGRRLLVVLALAACGGGGEDSPDAAPNDTTQRDTAPAPSAANAPCPAPPPAIPDSVLQGTWAGFVDWETTNAVSFKNTRNDSIEAPVPLCDTCTAVSLTIVSEARTNCLREDEVSNQTRLAGVLVVNQRTVAPPGWRKTFSPGDSIFVFGRDSAGPATLAYRGQSGTPAADSVTLAPAGAWNFRYCRDTPLGIVQGRWRKSEVSNEGDTERTYGWMACASGCCQFYVPPPPPPDPDDKAKGKGKGRENRPGSSAVLFPRCPDSH